jgi:2-polyprenyl-3-methyl-5-hydroxy-6-metoxy-1,4-benzoquinol methylase
VTDRLAALLPTATVLGVDADDPVLRSHWERRTRDGLKFKVGSGYALGFADGTYDVVCAIEVLEHVERPGDMHQEMARVARQSLIVSVPREPLWRLSHLLAGRNLRSLGDTPGHINHWSSRSFTRLANNYGLIKHLSHPLPWTLAVLDVRS